MKESWPELSLRPRKGYEPKQPMQHVPVGEPVFTTWIREQMSSVQLYDA